MITRQHKEALLGQRGCVVWFTGLSGSGKTTLALALEEHLHNQGKLTHILDGDVIRDGLCSDLGFGQQSRRENIRRITEVSAIMADVGIIVLVSFISPYKEDRLLARFKNHPSFVEVYVDTPLHVCEKRDVKGLYKKARAGVISDFTGISAPYEPPDNAEVVLDTSTSTIIECLKTLVAQLV